MAKKKKNKAGGQSSAKPSAPSANKKSENVEKTPIEIAFERGNYASVHRLAQSSGDAGKTYLNKVKLDMVPILIGICASALAFTVAAMTLHTH